MTAKIAILTLLLTGCGHHVGFPQLPDSGSGIDPFTGNEWAFWREGFRAYHAIAPRNTLDRVLYELDCHERQCTITDIGQDEYWIRVL